MSRVVDWFRVQPHRAYLYRVAAAGGAVAGGYGLISGTELAVWLGFAATALGTGTAVVNTPTK